MAAGTISLVAVLRDARILRQAQERAPQDEADGRYRYDSNFGNAALPGRPDVLVHAEQVVGIVAALDFSEAAIVRAIRLLDAVIFIARHEIDVDAARREGGSGLKELACPRDAGRILSFVAPARVRIHDEVGVAIWPRGSVG